MAMRDQIKESIEQGGATKESLLQLTGTTEKGLASQFTYLRMMGNCPMKQEDGTYKIVSTEKWEAHRASSGTKSEANLTPKQKVEKAEKRSKRATSAFDAAKKRSDNDPENRLLQLRFVKAEAELEISEIELGIAETKFANTPQTDENDQNDEGMVYEENDEEETEDDLQ